MRHPCWSIQPLFMTASSFRSSSMTSYLLIHKARWLVMECIELLRPTENSVHRSSQGGWARFRSRNLCDSPAALGWTSHLSHSSLGAKTTFSTSHLGDRMLEHVSLRLRCRWACSLTWCHISQRASECCQLPGMCVTSCSYNVLADGGGQLFPQPGWPLAGQVNTRGALGKLRQIFGEHRAYQWRSYLKSPALWKHTVNLKRGIKSSSILRLLKTGWIWNELWSLCGQGLELNKQMLLPIPFLTCYVNSIYFCSWLL